MITQREQLEVKTLPELRSMLTIRGMNWQKTEKKIDIINRIIELDNICQPNDKPKEINEEKKEVKCKKNTKEEVLEAIKPFMFGGMQARINEEFWEFRNGNKLDSGTLSMPLTVIVRCADFVSR